MNGPCGLVISAERRRRHGCDEAAGAGVKDAYGVILRGRIGAIQAARQQMLAEKQNDRYSASKLTKR